jgi:ABC-type glycerol-3-phosphate transport system permease component
MRHSGRILRALVYLVLVGYTIYTVGPLLWLVLSSFRASSDILESPFGLPTTLYLGNYQALGKSAFWLFYRNSVVVVAGGLAGTALLSTTLAYGLARFRFRGRELITALIFSAIMLPPPLVAVPLFRQMQIYGLLNSHAGLMLVYAAFALPMAVYILRAFFAKIPEELSDSARVDGATEWQVFLRVILPIAKPAVITILILWFVLLFNEFVLGLVLLQSTAKRTLPVGLTLLNSEYRVNYGALSAALVMSALPILVGYAAFSEHFIRGMSAGALKE